ncbi:sodium-dependent glucose transporter 1-like [Ruditapes philippinarum]|uniref:sodium-dependent glucose transporter 1-like n=1 Tax=Ruditapes philippinarum TaxID=129788 RepID=UPI00295AD7B3|nr:sodium-dependent glucose transporter 1-like [Ruditapes philippinarum]
MDYSEKDTSKSVVGIKFIMNNFDNPDRGTNENPVIKDDSETESTTFLGKLRYNGEYRIRFLHTCFVVWMFITLGWNVSVVGGTFPDLRLIIQKDLETASWIFTLGSLGYLLGAFIGGLLFDRMNRLLLLIIVTILNALAIAAFPWCSTFPTMLAINFFSGLFNGGMDVGGNSHVASIWGRNSAPFMQTIHFGFSFGGIISPLSAEPFLAPKSCPSELVENITVTAFTTTELPVVNVTTGSEECEEVYGETHIHYAYLIAGIVSLTATIPFLCLFLLSQKYATYVDSPLASSDIKNENTIDDLPKLSLKKKITFVTLLMLLISIYACTEARFSGLLTTFLTEYLDWSTAEGLHVTSLFWGTFAAGRFLGILVTRFVKTPTMIGIYVGALTLSFVGMFLAARYNIEELVWACAALAGMSMSVIFPAIFTWTGESILNVTGTISAVYLVGVSLFNMLFPLLYGHLMDNYTQMYFVDLLIAQCVITICIYISIRVLLKVYVKNHDLKGNTNVVS